MPTYNIENEKTGEVKEVFCSYKDKDKELKKHGKDWKYQVSGINLSYNGKSVQSRLDNGFKDVLTRIKSASGKDNTINTGR